MTLDEVIKHAEEVAEEKSNRAVRIRDNMKSEIALSNADECETCADEHRQLAEWLKELKQLREQTRWIPCSERLPKIHNRCEKYLVTLEHGGTYVALFTECDGKHWWSYDDVVAWMPLPKPYEKIKGD